MACDRVVRVSRAQRFALRPSWNGRVYGTQKLLHTLNAHSFTQALGGKAHPLTVRLTGPTLKVLLNDPIHSCGMTACALPPLAIDVTKKSSLVLKSDRSAVNPGKLIFYLLSGFRLTVVIGLQLAHEERKFLGHIYTDKVFLDHVCISIGKRENYGNDVADTA